MVTARRGGGEGRAGMITARRQGEWRQPCGREAEGPGNGLESGGEWVVFRTFASLSI